MRQEAKHIYNPNKMILRSYLRSIQLKYNRLGLELNQQRQPTT